MYIVVETFQPLGEPSSASLRVRPGPVSGQRSAVSGQRSAVSGQRSAVSGQGYGPDVRVECSRATQRQQLGLGLLDHISQDGRQSRPTKP